MNKQAALVLILLSTLNLASCSKVKEMDKRTEEMTILSDQTKSFYHFHRYFLVCVV